MKVARDVLKRWFSDGKTPTGEQFAYWQDSYYHKDDPIKPENVDGLKKELEELKENKEDKTDATNKYNDLDARKEDKAEADKKFGDLNAAVTNLQSTKEDRADADKRFGDLNAAITNLQNTKEDQADATNKYNDLDARKEDKVEADKKFGDLNAAVTNLQNTKEDQADATNKYNDLNGRKEDKAEADKKFGDLNAAVTNLQSTKEDRADADKRFGDLNAVITNLQNTKEDQADAQSKFDDLNSRKEDKAEADKKFGDLNAAVTNLQNTKEDQADATNKYNDLNDRKEDKADMVNYLRIDPNGLQNNDIAIHEGGQWVRKQASEISMIKPLTVQQNGQTIGIFDGRNAATINVDAAKTDGTGAHGTWPIHVDGSATYLNGYYNEGNKLGPEAFTPYGLRAEMIQAVNDFFLDTIYVNGYNSNKGSGFNYPWVNIIGFVKGPENHNDVYHATGNYGADSWKQWYRFLDEGNFNEFAPGLHGENASGTWNIDVNANNISCANLNNVQKINTNANNYIVSSNGVYAFFASQGQFYFWQKINSFGDIYCRKVWATQQFHDSKNLSLRRDPVNHIQQANSVEIFWNSDLKLPEFDVESVKQNLPDLISDNEDEEGNVISHSLNVQAILMAKLAAMEDTIKKQEDRINQLEQRLGEN